jgi:hypothetical protein
VRGEFLDTVDKTKKNALRRTKITYRTEKIPGSLYSRLTAETNGNQYLIIDESSELCLSVFDVRDFDENGSIDALITDITACGGNCCGNSFFFVSFLGNGHFQTSASFGYSWKDPVIEKWKGLSSVIVTDNNEGVNQIAPEETTARYVLDSGKAVKVEESERRGLVALSELNSSDFDFDKTNEQKTISFDLDGDGVNDLIVGELWHRWGRISWSVALSRGETVKSEIACKRIGILPTKTNGFNDLVCDHDDVLRWSGKAYL